MKHSAKSRVQDLVRDDYAGAGGWSEGLKLLGLADYGIEMDADACATRAAAGHATIRADLSSYRIAASPRGYIASPPCQSFSAAGKGVGRAALPQLVAAIHAEDWDTAASHDPRTRHVLDAARVATTCGAQWIAMEQVVPVLPAWEAITDVLTGHGYSAWAGVLNAADYGVPQTRRRAILIASRSTQVKRPPPTHCETPSEHLAPWLTWGESLGFEGLWNIDPRQGRTTNGVRRKGRDTPSSRPAPTFGGQSAKQWLLHQEPRVAPPIKLTYAQSSRIQTFRDDYPWQGLKGSVHQQIGNAVPPLLAAHIVAAATGLPPGASL